MMKDCKNATPGETQYHLGPLEELSSRRYRCLACDRELETTNLRHPDPSAADKGAINLRAKKRRPLKPFVMPKEEKNMNSECKELEPVHLQRIHKLMDLFAGMHPSGHYQGVWIKSDLKDKGRLQEDFKKVAEGHKSDCGTSACVYGWFPHLWPDDFQWWFGNKIAQKGIVKDVYSNAGSVEESISLWLGISNVDAMRLMLVSEGPQTPGQAVAFLEGILRNYKATPEEAEE